MACCDNTTPPASGPGAAARCDGGASPCETPECPTVEIEINNTPATNDDLVQVKGTHPVLRHKVPCRIRATGGAVDGTIILTNPDGRLRFPNDADTTKTLNVPHDGSWVAFEISGETGSNALNDAVIEAHCNTATGSLKGSKTVTVFWFDQAKIDITIAGNYSITGGAYQSSPSPSVSYSAEARIRPAGVDCTVPQIKDLRIGILQNLFAPSIRTTNWGNPTIQWIPDIPGHPPIVPRGTPVTVPTIIRQTVNNPVTLNDSAAGVAPIYDQPGVANVTIDANSLKPPKGCTGGGAATSNDSPTSPAVATVQQNLTTPAGTIYATVVWTLINITMHDNFRTWAVVFNISDNTLSTLRERVWRTQMDSAAGHQHPTFDADSAPTIDPITIGPFPNDVAGANTTTGPFGAATTTFRKP